VSRTPPARPAAARPPGAAAGRRPASGARSSGRHRRPGDRAARWLAGAGVVLALAACGGARGGADSPDDVPTRATPVAESPTPTGIARKDPAADDSWGPVTAAQSPVAAPTERAAAGVVRPLSVSIPSIGVSSSLVPLQLIPGSGELAAPAHYGQAGWYAAGPTPGEAGPAVIAGHVDSRAGPAVFFRLREVTAGDLVEVRRSDGVTARFAVTGVERYPKPAFPTQRVHGPTPDRALRLITCGGSFDHAKRSYRDNVVVYAVRT